MSEKPRPPGLTALQRLPTLNSHPQLQDYCKIDSLFNQSPNFNQS